MSRHGHLEPGGNACTMSIHWTPELSVGVEEIDNQHKELYRNVDPLLRADPERGTGTETSQIFSHTSESYVTAHFSLEEKYMAKFHVDGCGYEDAKEHKAEHRAFLRDFTAFKEEVLENGPTPLLVDEFQKWIVNWMAGHLGKTDRDSAGSVRSALPFLKRN
ncbi:MAG: hemerythrin domain-containing protein [Desulfobacterales bacterium]|nr:hemerythrin domain-containing protein [Desulfobacterales bacterium]